MKEFKKSARELIDNYSPISFKTISQYCTKKYVNGKRNVGIPPKLQKYMAVGHDTNWVYNRIDRTVHEKVLVYFDDPNECGLIDGWMVYGVISANKYTIMGICLSRTTHSSREIILDLDLRIIRDLGFPITDEAFFAIQTAVDLHGITKNELHYIVKVANSLKQ